LVQLSVVVKHLESLQVIHGDLCPENIVIGKDGFIRVIDFGSAQRLDQAFTKIIDQGHPPFTAAVNRFSMGADRYSLGCLLKFWLGDIINDEEEAWVQLLCEDRTWPEALNKDSSLLPLEIFPFIGMMDSRDHRIPKTKLQRRDFQIYPIGARFWSFVRSTPIPTVFFALYLTSFLPGSSLSFTSFPLSWVEIRQGDFVFRTDRALTRMPLRTGEVRLIVEPSFAKWQKLERVLQLRSGREYKIFEDFQNLDNLKEWTKISNRM
jgi:serine/threonine protein kinase